MNFSILTVVVGSALVTLVESRCYNFHPMTVDYDHLCWKWWEKGYDKYDYRHRARRSCVQLIIKKCPEMITITSSTSRYHDGGNDFETWTTRFKASLKSNTNTWMTYNEKEERSVCYDDGVQKCDYWWKIAKDSKLKNKVREVCINNIWKHCRSKLNKESETKTDEVTRCSRAYDVKTVTYNYDSETTSFKKYVPV